MYPQGPPHLKIDAFYEARSKGKTPAMPTELTFSIFTINCLMNSHTHDCAFPSDRIYAMHGQKITTFAATQVTI